MRRLSRIPVVSSLLISRVPHKAWLLATVLLWFVTVSTASAQLSGSYTVGGDSPDFATIQEAVDALMTDGVGGPVQIRLRPGTYEPANPDELVFSIPDTIPGASGANRVSIEPDKAAGGAVGNVVVRITDGAPGFTGASIADIRASYVTLREITFENADDVSTGTLPPLVTMSVLRAENPPTGNTVERCRFLGRSASTTTISSVSVYGESTDLLIEDNEMSGGYHGVAISGRATRPIIRLNTITDLPGVLLTNSPSNSAIGLGGGSVDAVVEKNFINFEGRGGAVYGIALTNAENFVVTANRIVRFPVLGGLNPGDVFSGIQILQTSAAAKAAGGIISNNMVAGTYAGNRWGIRVVGDNVRVLHNSVFHPARGIGCSFQREAGIHLEPGTGHTVSNNLVQDDTQTPCSNSAALVIADTTGNTFGPNNLIGPDVGAVVANGVKYFTVEQWNSEVSGTGSFVSKQPAFAGFDDLHLTECSVVDEDLRGIPEPLVVVDFDEEGRDVIAPFMGADEPQGGPPPLFQGPGVYTAGTGSFQFDSGDLDLDGDMDIVVTNPGSAGGGAGANVVTVLLNDGNGGFEAPVDLDFGTDPNSIRIGLINADGVPDLVVRGDGGVLVRFGLGAAAFSAPVQIGPFGRSDLELADYDNDGDTDVFVVAGDGSSVVVVFINQGDGTFSEVTDFALLSTETVTDLAIADVNGDDFLDVLAVEATGAGRFLVLENLGVQAPGISAGFGEAVTYEFATVSDPSRSRFEVEDLDGDLDLDVVLGAAAGGDSLVVIRNNGDGTFGQREAFDVHYRGVPEVVTALDYERDGDMDLVVASSLSNVDLLLNQGTGDFERVILCDNGALSGLPIGMVANPFNDDASTDVAVLTFEGGTDGRVELLYNLEWRPSGVAIEDPADVPSETSRLHPNYPNPFSNVTTVRYKLSTSSPVRLDVFDLLGRRVATVVDEVRPAGEHSIQFDAQGMASGIYLYRIAAGEFVETRRMVVVR